jgi:hypothetical protein
MKCRIQFLRFAEFMITWINWNVIWLYHSTRHQENIPDRYRDMQALFWKCKKLHPKWQAFQFALRGKAPLDNDPVIGAGKVKNFRPKAVGEPVIEYPADDVPF